MDMAWDDLRYLLATHRTGSHKAAARQLRVATTTVGRRLAALEAAVGVRLLLRTPERVVATEAGRALLEHAERIEAEVLASERRLRGGDEALAGPLRVTAGDGLINGVLVPALEGLRRLHPALALELRAETRIVDLSRREADLAIRLVRPREASLVARRLGEMRFGIFAGERYLQRRGAPRTLEAAAAHDWIGFEAALDDLPQVRWLLRSVPGIRFALRSNTTTTQAIACAEGLGLALLPLFAEGREPRLRRLFARVAGPSRELWAVTHADLRGNARVGAFVEWLRDVLAAPPPSA
jgi:DNA-binding transcriptional LysR family regulator